MSDERLQETIESNQGNGSPQKLLRELALSLLEPNKRIASQEAVIAELQRELAIEKDSAARFQAMAKWASDGLDHIAKTLAELQASNEALRKALKDVTQKAHGIHAEYAEHIKDHDVEITTGLARCWGANRIPEAVAQIADAALAPTQEPRTQAGEEKP